MVHTLHVMREGVTACGLNTELGSSNNIILVHRRVVGLNSVTYVKYFKALSGIVSQNRINYTIGKIIVDTIYSAWLLL